MHSTLCTTANAEETIKTQITASWTLSGLVSVNSKQMEMCTHSHRPFPNDNIKAENEKQTRPPKTTRRVCILVSRSVLSFTKPNREKESGRNPIITFGNIFSEFLKEKNNSRISHIFWIRNYDNCCRSTAVVICCWRNSKWHHLADANVDKFDFVLHVRKTW